MPAPFARSSTGCSMSPAPCWKIERCLTRHSGSRRTQLRDSPGYCAGDELHHLLFTAHRRNDWQQRRPGGGLCQGRQPPKAGAIASLYRAPPRPAHTRLPTSTSDSSPVLAVETVPKKPQEVHEKSTCKKVGSPVHAPFTPVAICPVTRHPTDLSQKRLTPLVLTTSESFRRVIEGFTFVRLPDTHLLGVMPRTFAPTLTTTAFDRSRLEWFGTRS